MAFDAKTFLENPGSLTGIAGSFGVPKCMLTLAGDLLGLVPTPILLAMREAMLAGQRLADAIIKKLYTYIREKLGISLFPNRDGFFGFFSEYSRFGLDLISGITAAISAFLAILDELKAAAELVESKYNQIKGCLEEFKNFLEFKNGSAAEQREKLNQLDPDKYREMLNSEFGILIAEAEVAQDFVNQARAQVEVIEGIVTARTLDPALEPGPEPDAAIESVFRLGAAPPLSRTGKFVLSVDGLYYDSQVSGIIPALLELENRSEQLEINPDGFENTDLWKLEFDPSLGGRGVPTTSKDLKYYFNNILDPSILDNSRDLQKFYDQDNLLQSLEGQKDRKVFDVSTTINEAIEDGSSIAIIDNMRQVMISETSHFQDKIDKRKKQIELAVKVPVFLGKGPQFDPGNIPVNDFSYLAGSNFLVDIENQRKIVLDQADVTGVVLPIETKFSERIKTSEAVVLDHILLANVAKGETISNPLDPSAPTLHVNTRISEDNLIALYNYLSVKTDVASGTDFGVYNSSRLGIGYNSQMVGTASSIFDRGLGIPFLSGVSFPKEGSSEIDATGSYVRLPENPEFQDFLYRKEGATFETWIHMPNLDGTTQGWNMHDNDTLGLYRLILANENVGISDSKAKQSDINNMDADHGTGIVRGAILGFTRDRRFTSNLPPSNDNADNSVDDLVLVLAPTQSFDSSSAGFVANKTDCIKNSLHGMTIPVFEEQNGMSLSSCGRSFAHLSVSLDPKQDEIRVYLDGVKLATSSYQSTFGTRRAKDTYKAPSIKQNNSFEYSEGPSLDTYFTPWILGGGYTDGLSAGNFMGGEFGGKVSGLKGYLGCTRFYSKPLEDDEVVNNYKATKNFFKNIVVT
tara:strand:+ start:3200 stop:5779 length:2580 start_codon:yes stop_codon:yes gene_type:complete